MQVVSANMRWYVLSSLIPERGPCPGIIFAPDRNLAKIYAIFFVSPSTSPPASKSTGEKEIAHAYDVRSSEENHAVAIGVAIREVHNTDFFVVEVDGQ